jgi:hypothetical protein
MNTGKIQKFMFNPNTITDDLSVQFSEIGNSGGAGKKYQYVGTDNRAINIEFFLRGTTDKINEFKDFLEGFVPTGKFTPPPVLMLAFGSYIKKCIMLNLHREWRDFDKNLKVREMIIKLSLKEVS